MIKFNEEGSGLEMEKAVLQSRAVFEERALGREIK
jgi:hypothetical protein